jgi:hypothetical protein
MRWQHGDVILVMAEKFPKDAKKIEVGASFIVERGEGMHTHVIEDTTGLEARVDSKGVMWLGSATPKIVNHEEHGPKIIPAGICYKEIENEYDAEKDEAFKTKD